MVDGGALVAGDEEVEAHGPHVLGFDPLVANLAVLVALGLTPAAESHAIAHTAAAAFPEVLVAQPGTGQFALAAVLVDDLREDAVVVANAVAGRRIAQGRQRIEEAGREASEAAVAQSRILFLGRDLLEFVTERTQRDSHFIEHA